MHALCALMLTDMGAHLVEQPQMGALRDQEIVHRPEDRPERISVGDPPFAHIRPAMVFYRYGRARDPSLEQSARIDLFQRAQRVVAQVMDLDRRRAAEDRPRENPLWPAMHPEKGEGIRSEERRVGKECRSRGSP